MRAEETEGRREQVVDLVVEILCQLSGGSSEGLKLEPITVVEHSVGEMNEREK